MKLLLIRHGRTIANVMGALDTDFPGNPLDERGREQAADIPRRLAHSGYLRQITSLWVSPILRARQTIAPLEEATGLEARICSGLREVIAGDLEMNTDTESVACYVDTTRAWMTGRLHARLPGSPEHGAHTLERFNAVVEQIAHSSGDDDVAALVSHGTILRLWTARMAAEGGGVDSAWIADHPMPNAVISVVSGDPERGWCLESWAEGAWDGK